MKPSQVNLPQIISFYYVAKEGSYEQAAESLFLTQSAVVQHIKSLETQYKMKFIIVKKHKVYLTADGDRLFAYAEAFVHQLMTMESFLKTYRLATLHLGIARMLMFYMMPVIDRFNELYPSIRVTVREGKSVDLVGELFNFRHDIVFVGDAYPKSDLYPTDRLAGYRVATVEKMVFVAGPDYPLPTDVGLEWETLAREPLIIQSAGSNVRLVVLDEFKRRGLTPLIGMEVDNVEAGKKLASQNWGIALIFLPNVREDIAAGRLKVIPVVGGGIRVGIDILENPEITPSVPARNFIELLKVFFGELDPL